MPCNLSLATDDFVPLFPFILRDATSSLSFRPQGVRHHPRSRWIPPEAPRRTSGTSWIEEDSFRRPLSSARVLPRHPPGTVASLSNMVREALRRNTRHRRQGNEHGG